MQTVLAERTLSLCSRCHLPIDEDAERCPLCRPSEPRAPLPARVGPYRVVGMLARRSDVRVFAATGEDGVGSFAVKVFDDSGDRLRGRIERHLRDARFWARISHPNVVRLHGIGRWCGLPFVAMERVSGRSAADLLAETGPLDPRTALVLIGEAARGLEAAAQAGLLHRGIKPANLLLGTDGRVKLTDPGLANESSGDGALPDPIAPETREGGIHDHRSDIYALGVTLGRLLGIYDAPGPGLPAAPIEPPAAVAALLLRMTAHRREDRFAGYGELRAAILAALDALEPHAGNLARRRDRSWMAAGALAGFLLAAAVAALVPNQPADPPPATVASAPAGPADASVEPAPADGPAGDAVKAIVQQSDFSVPASYSYVMGSEEARASFTLEGAGAERRLRRLGGRLVLPPGAVAAWTHSSVLQGDLRAELDLVLRPGAQASLALRSPGGAAIEARLRAWGERPSLIDRARLAATPTTAPDAGVLLLAGSPPAPVAGTALALAPGQPHHLELRREGAEVRIYVDGREAARAEIPFDGSYRLVIAAPQGGAELRSFGFSADRETEPTPAG